MFQRKYIFLILTLLISLSYRAQCDTLRYEKPIFNSITAHNNVVYGSARVWNVPYNKTNLKINIFTPDDDTLTKRPLMIWVHPGGFLTGNKELDDMMALCDSFARRGYVTATIDYRKGFNLVSATSAERAVYRGVQDLRAAIRYLKEHHEVYGIDTNYTFIGGSSAGAFSVLQTVYMDQNESPSSIAGGNGFPDLGCLDCEGNEYIHNMDITGYVSLWGAIGDSNWISVNETTPGLLVHGKADGTVPFGVGHPFGVPTTPKTHGSRTVSNKLNSLNIPHTTYFVEGEGHEFHGTSNGDWNNPPTPYWDTIYNLIENHYLDIIRDETLPISGPSFACTRDTITFQVNTPANYKLCWDVQDGEIIAMEGNTIQVVYHQLGQKVVSAKQFTEIGAYNGEAKINFEIREGQQVNFIYSENGTTYSFTPLPTGFMYYNWNFGDGNFAGSLAPTHTYSSPGTYTVKLITTSTNGCKAENSKTIDVNELALLNEEFKSMTLFPNPTQGNVFLNSELALKEVIVFSVTGQEHLRLKLSGKENLINLSELNNGTYLLKIRDINNNYKISKIVLEK